MSLPRRGSISPQGRWKGRVFQQVWSIASTKIYFLLTGLSIFYQSSFLTMWASGSRAGMTVLDDTGQLR